MSVFFCAPSVGTAPARSALHSESTRSAPYVGGQGHPLALARHVPRAVVVRHVRNRAVRRGVHAGGAAVDFGGPVRGIRILVGHKRAGRDRDDLPVNARPGHVRMRDPRALLVLRARAGRTLDISTRSRGHGDSLGSAATASAAAHVRAGASRAPAAIEQTPVRSCRSEELREHAPRGPGRQRRMRLAAWLAQAVAKIR